MILQVLCILLVPIFTCILGAMEQKPVGRAAQRRHAFGSSRVLLTVVLGYVYSMDAKQLEYGPGKSSAALPSSLAFGVGGTVTVQLSVGSPCLERIRSTWILLV